MPPVWSDLQFLSSGECRTINGGLKLLIDQNDVTKVDRERRESKNHNHENCCEHHNAPAT